MYLQSQKNIIQEITILLFVDIIIQPSPKKERGCWYSIWVIKNHCNISSFGLRFFQKVSKRFWKRKRNIFVIKTDYRFRKIFWEVLEELLLSNGSPATKTAIIKHCQPYTCYVTRWYTSSVNIAQISTQRCDCKALHFRCTVRSHY